MSKATALLLLQTMMQHILIDMFLSSASNQASNENRKQAVIADNDGTPREIKHFVGVSCNLGICQVPTIG